MNIRISKHMGSAAVVLALATSLPSTASAQRVALRIELGRSIFFEDEPIYVVFELRNTGPDTLWGRHFGLAYQNLTAQLHRDGCQVPELVFVVDYFPGPNWRGEPLAPGSAFYDTGVLQDRWGTADVTSPDVFIRHLGTGSYELTARYVSGGETFGLNPVQTETGPIRFEVRPRTPEEEASFREFERVRRLAWKSSQRGRYLREVLALAEIRVSVNATDPFLAFLLRNGISTAQAIGQWPDADTTKGIAQLMTAVANAQKSLPSGAVVVDALYSQSPDLVSAVPDLLRGSFAGQVAAERAKRKRGASVQPQRQ